MGFGVLVEEGGLSRLGVLREEGGGGERDEGEECCDEGGELWRGEVHGEVV